MTITSLTSATPNHLNSLLTKQAKLKTPDADDGVQAPKPSAATQPGVGQLISKTA